MLFHVLAHVDLDQGILVAEHELGQCLGSQRLTNPRRSGEQEYASRSLGIFQAAAAATNSLGDLLDCFGLADDSTMQFFFHSKQTNCVFAGESRQRNPGHLRNNFRDHFGIDNAVGFLGLFAPVLVQVFLLLLQLVSLITQ